METLLTTGEVQGLLRVDRTTVYRMLREGRLRGVKVGQQWRFERGAVDALLRGAPQPAATPPSPLPTHCMQTIQDLFAELADVGALTATLDGHALTAPSGDAHHAAALRAAAAAAQGGALTARAADGRTYMAAPVLIDGRPAALVVAGPAEPWRAEQVRRGLLRLADAAAALGRERAGVLARLRHIAELSCADMAGDLAPAQLGG